MLSTVLYQAVFVTMTLFWHQTTSYDLNAYITPKGKIRRKT